MSMVQQRRGAGFLVEETDPEDVLTPEDMDDEQRMMMRAIREFAEKELPPVEAEVEKRNPAVVRELFKKAADLGIFMAEVPEEYGGLGLSVLGIAGMNESRSYLGPMASTVFAHQGIGSLPLINFGTKAQIDKYLAPLMDGTMMAAFALTEPSSGSDAMNIRSTARLSDDGAHYIINGSKQFITNAGWADLFILFAKVDGTHFTAFLVERDSPGLTVGENEKLLGLHSSSVCGLTLDHVKVPVENVLGEIGKGHKVALCTLNLGRLKMAANCAGSAKRVLACAAKYAGERVQFGRPIAEFGLIQRKLADMAARAYASESIAYRTAGLVYQALEAMGGEEKKSIDAKLKALAEFSIECALAKVHGSETYNYLADEAIQVHGGYGFSEEYPPAKMYRDSRITRIYEGTSEICRMSAMKAVLKRAGKNGLDLAAQARAAEADGPPNGDHFGDDLGSLRNRIRELKSLWLHLFGKLMHRVGREGILGDDKQQFLSSLADIALELYAAESVVLRVMKLQRRHPEDVTRLPAALARLYFERAADRVRQESEEIVSALFTGDALREELRRIAARLPLPRARLELRAFVAATLVANGGALPEFRN